MARIFTGLFGASKQTQPPVSALRINTSLQGVPVALLLGGMQRMAGNLIDYYNFYAEQISSTGGKGGVASLFKGGPQETIYYVTFLLGICEGLCTVDYVWVNGNGYTIYTDGQQTLTLPGVNGNNLNIYEVFEGDYAQQPWGYSEAVAPGHALGYRGLCYVAFENFGLNDASTLPNLTFQVISSNVNALPGQPDGDVTVALTNFLTNTYYGIGLPANRLASLASWQQYCLALGLVVSPVLASSTQASSFAKDLTDATNAAACWQDGELNVVPYGDAAVSAGEVSQSIETYEVPTGPTYPNPNDSGTPYEYPQVTVSFWALFAGDGGVTYASGTPLERVTSYAPTGVTGSGSPGIGQYYESGGIYYFNPGDINQEVIITYDWAAAASYVPDTTPIYDFTIDDCLPNQLSIGQGISDPSSPFMAVRKPRDQMLNNIKVEYLDRNNTYNPVDIEVKDEASIVAFGRERPSELKQFHFFCLAGAAQQSATLQLIRQQVARTFQWTVGRHFGMILKLMALVTITDPGQGLDLQPARIIEIQENQDFSYTITAEEYLGTVSAPAYGSQPSQGAGVNYNAAPGPINPPLIFEPTDELGGGNYIWLAASGQNPDLWGGADVWVSTEANGTYSRVGRVGPARMGVLSAALPAVAVNIAGQTIDQANAVSVDLTQSKASLGSGSVLDAVTLADPCYVGGEIVCYATATLTGTNKYNLTYLVRGAFGTEDKIVAHAAGTQFVRLDSATASFAFQPGQIGTTIYIKLTGFNIYDGGQQSLADVTAYPYTITGAALASPLPNVANLRTAYNNQSGFQQLDWDIVEDFRNPIYEVRSGASWAAGVTLGRPAAPPFTVPGDGTYWVSAYCQPTAGVAVYSEEPQDVAISGAVITQNVVLTIDLKALGWPGTFSGGAGIDGTLDAIRTGGADILSDANILATPDMLDYGGGSAGAYFPLGAYLDIGYVTGASVVIEYQPTGVPVGQDVLTIGDFLDAPDVLGSASSAYVDVYPQINIATAPGGDLYSLGDLYQYPDLYEASDPSWNGFQKFSPGTYQARYLDFAMVMETSDPSTIAYDLAFKVLVTIPSRIDTYSLTTSASGATAVTFQPANASAAAAFNGGPASGNLPAVQATVIGAQAGDDLVISGLTLSGLNVEVLNGGTPVARAIVLTVQGY